MILEAILLAFSWHFFKWLFRVLLVAVIGAKANSSKESLLEKVKTKTEDVKGAMKEHDNATNGADW